MRVLVAVAVVLDNVVVALPDGADAAADGCVLTATVEDVMELGTLCTPGTVGAINVDAESG